MKKMKQVVTGLLLAAWLLSCLAGLPALRLEAAAASESDLTFAINRELDGYIVTACKETATGDLVIPATYRDLPVKDINVYAFEGCQGLTSVVIPEGVETIGENAFTSCTGLKSVTIAGSVKSIENEVFYGCFALQEVHFLGSAPEIADSVFLGTTVTAYYTPDSTWTEDVMQDYGGAITWVSRKTPGQSVTVTYRSFGDAGDTLTMQIFPIGSAEAAYRFTTTAASANSGSWTVEGVASGSYTVKAEKANHVTREYTLTVGDTAAALEVELSPVGDVNGDGRVNFTDYGKVLSQAKNPSAGALEGYGLQCADVNGDGKINFSDYGKILSQAKGNNTLW